MPAVLSAADVALVPLRKVELFEHAVPSKLFDAWACGCPVLLSIDGEARRVLEAANGGMFVPPEDHRRWPRQFASWPLCPIAEKAWAQTDAASPRNGIRGRRKLGSWSSSFAELPVNGRSGSDW